MPTDDELAGAQIELEALRRQNRELRARLVQQMVRPYPADEEAPAETLCRHGKERRGETRIGCDAPCKNANCLHPCSAHAMNCLKMVGLDAQKRPIYCPCIGLQW